MIFDCDVVTKLVVDWQRTQDPDLMDQIIEKSMTLVEVLVSSYDYHYRDDLIQEACMRLQYATQFFDADIANLHTYFTTVIKNICVTYLRRQERYAREPDIDLSIIGEEECGPDKDVLTSLIIRNRIRFPSLLEVIDEMTEAIYTSLTYEERKRQIVNDLVSMYDLDKKYATVVYMSTVMYLRFHYKEFAEVVLSDHEAEFSIIPDMEELFGEIIADRVAKVMTGFNIRFP